MSTEAQVAMLMLRILIDRPKELQKVLEYLEGEVLLRKAILEVGNKNIATREQIMSEFEEKYGLTVDIDDEPDTVPKSMISGNINRTLVLPSGARFKVS
jgi:hypothetical protein